MLTSRALIAAVALLAWAPSHASAQAADDAAPASDPPCDAQCVADAASAPADDTADDPDTGDEPVDAGDAADDGTDDADDQADDADDDADLPPAPGSLDAALEDGVVHAGTFAAPRAGRLKVVLVATPGAKGPVLGRLTTRVARPGRVALDLKLTAAGEDLLSDADDDVTLVARTAWTSKRSTHVRTAERRVALPLDLG